MKSSLIKYIVAGLGGIILASCTSIRSITDSIQRKDRSPQIEMTTISDSVVPHSIATGQIPYLKFKALEKGSFSFSKAGLLYSLDGGETWKALDANMSTPVIGIGDSVIWKNNSEMTPASSEEIGTFSSTGRFDASGNIVSLYFGDDCKTKADLTGKDYAFSALFSFCTGLVNAEALELPATALADYCYSGMFEDCINLKTAPELPAMILTTGCYSSMFKGCVNLASVPELPAISVANGCYNSMFEGCKSLTDAPALPATTLAKSCYSSMFEGCTGLSSAPVLPATMLAKNCYSGMFYGCTSLTAAPELPATVLEDYCYSSMFGNCTGLKTAPKLPATKLAESCYSGMFNSCTSLTDAPELPAMILTTGCYEYMFYGCTGLTTAPVLPARILAVSCYTSMFMNCSNLNSIKAAFITPPSITYTNMWAFKVNPSGKFYKAGDAKWKVKGVNAIPSGWGVIKLPRNAVFKNILVKENSHGRKK